MMASCSAIVEPVCTLRTYDGEAHTHAHDYAQIMVPLFGRMELEIAGRALFTDVSCGMVVPAGASHAYEARPGTRMLVIDTPDQKGLERVRRFAITAQCGRLAGMRDVEKQLEIVLRLPTVLSRRGIDLGRLDAALDAALHEAWPVARMAALFFLSPQRFHARLFELTGCTPGSYLRDRRLDAAEKALAQGLGLEAVASRVGYRTASALAFALSRDRHTGARTLRRRGAERA